MSDITIKLICLLNSSIKTVHFMVLENNFLFKSKHFLVSDISIIYHCILLSNIKYKFLQQNAPIRNSQRVRPSNSFVPLKIIFNNFQNIITILINFRFTKPCYHQQFFIASRHFGNQIF